MRRQLEPTMGRFAPRLRDTREVQVCVGYKYAWVVQVCVGYNCARNASTREVQVRVECKYARGTSSGRRKGKGVRKRREGRRGGEETRARVCSYRGKGIIQKERGSMDHIGIELGRGKRNVWRKEGR
eukprot:6208130-Pleurochrysis_carterae.AAC.1